MAPALKDAEPETLIKGTTCKWKKTYDDFPTSELWAVTWYLNGSETTLTVAGTIVGTEYQFAVTDADTAALAVGSYRWQTQAVLGGETYPVQENSLLVSPGFDGLGATDWRTHCQKTLEALEATIEGRASDAQKRVRLGDREIEHMSAAELIQWRKLYQAECSYEASADDVAAGKGTGRKIKTRFVRP